MAMDSNLPNDGDGDAIQDSKGQENTAMVLGPETPPKRETRSNFVKIADRTSQERLDPEEEEEVRFLREKLWKLEEENERLGTDLFNTNLRETRLRERVKELEMHMKGLKSRVERAEKIIIELKRNALESSRQTEQAETHMQGLQLVCVPKDEDSRDMQELVERLQHLSNHHGAGVLGLSSNLGGDFPHQRNISRVSGHDVLYPKDEDKILYWDNSIITQNVESSGGDDQVLDLQEEVKILSTKLKFAVKQRQSMKEVIIISEEKLAEMMVENHALKEEISLERRVVQAREKDVQNLETKLEAHYTSNQMLQSMLSLKRLMSDTKKIDFVTSLDQTLMDLTLIVDSQNACVVRLSAQNEELARLLQLQIKENEFQLVETSAAVKQKEEAVCALEHFKEQMVEWATEMDERNHNFEMLQEYVVTMESELRHCQSQCAVLLRNHEEVGRERDHLAMWQAHARTRFLDIEKQLDEKEKDMETLGREALHMSLEVELLRRRLLQMDEDILLRDGQISILRSDWEDS